MPLNLHVCKTGISAGNNIHHFNELLLGNKALLSSKLIDGNVSDLFVNPVVKLQVCCGALLLSAGTEFRLIPSDAPPL